MIVDEYRERKREREREERERERESMISLITSRSDYTSVA